LSLTSDMFTKDSTKDRILKAEAGAGQHYEANADMNASEDKSMNVGDHECGSRAAPITPRLMFPEGAGVGKGKVDEGGAGGPGGEGGEGGEVHNLHASLQDVFIKPAFVVHSPDRAQPLHSG